MRAVRHLLLPALIAFASCSDSGTGAIVPEKPVMSASVDERGLVMKTVTTDMVGSRYFVRGVTDSSEQVTISIDTLTAPRSWVVDPTTKGIYVRYSREGANGREEFAPTVGTIRITEHSETRTSGTFDFRAKRVGGSEMVRVSEGFFSTPR